MSSYGGAVIKLDFDLSMIDQGATTLSPSTIIELDQQHNDGAFAVTNIIPNIVQDQNIITNTAALIQRTKLTTFSQYGLGLKLVVSDGEAAPVPTMTPDTLETILGIKNSAEVDQEIYGYEPFGERIPSEINIKDKADNYPSVYALYDLGLFLGYPDGQVSKITLEGTGYGMDAEPILKEGNFFQTNGEVPISYIAYNSATQDLLVASDSNANEIYAFHYLADNKSQGIAENLKDKLRGALNIDSSKDLPLLVSSSMVDDGTYILFADASVVKLSLDNEKTAYKVNKIANTGPSLQLKDVQEIAVSQAQNYLALVNLEEDKNNKPQSYRMLLHKLNNSAIENAPDEVFKGFKHMVSNVIFSKDELDKDSLSFTLAKHGFIQPNEYQETLGGVRYGALYTYDIQAQKLMNPSSNALCYVEAKKYRDSSDNAKLSRVQQGFCYIPSAGYPQK